MNYEVNPMVQNELREKIKEKANAAVKRGDVKTLMHNKQKYVFPRVKLRKDWLYYNLQNDRTLTKAREFCEENDKGLDYFAEENFFNIQQQKDYHKIISGFVPASMAKILKATNDQRDPLYVTYEGIMANGNTRLSCFRENGYFEEIDCLIFPEDFSSDWNFIRQFVDKQDNAQDFSTDYPWYARAERIEKNIEEMNLDEPDYKTIADNMQYKDAKEARLHHDMLELARRFIENEQYSDYERLSDLEKLGVGEGAGIQVFTTLATVRRTNKKVDIAIKEKLTAMSFRVIATGETSPFASRHLAVSNIWSKNNILDELRKLEEKDGSKALNVLGGEKVSDDKKSLSSYDSKPFDGKDEKEIEKITDEFLNKTAAIKEATTASTMRAAYKKGLNGFISKWKSLNEHSLKADTDLAGIDQIIDELDELIKETKSKIKTLKK
jgi:hypothetical protein